MAIATHHPPLASTAVTASTIITILVAGCVATIGFDLFGQALSPMAGFAKLAPVGLANGTIKALFGANVPGGGHLMHYAVGLIGYPLGWLLVARPLASRLTPWMPTALVAIAYGVGLWVFALYIMAHLVVGMPAFLGFTGITWVAFVGHVVYALFLVASLKWISECR